MQNGELLREQMTAQSVTESLHAASNRFSPLPTSRRTAGACGVTAARGRRILLVGPKGAGKTTLALCPLQDGYEIEGDENVFVTPDGLSRARVA